MSENEFAAPRGIVIHLSGFSQAYWIKGERPEDTDASQIDVDGHKVWLSADAVSKAPGFLPLLEAIVADRRERIDRLENYINFCRGG